jgi:DNA-binding response OmpR family regulator
MLPLTRILIIEDDPIIAHIYRTRLENEAYAVETCNDGRIGLDHVREFDPHAILLDLMLPTMNGIEFVKKLRAQIKFASVPVVVFTNAYLPNMIKEATSAGASQVYNKATVTPNQLLDCLHFLVYGINRVSAPSVIPSIPQHSSGTVPGETPGSPPPPANYGYVADCKGASTPQAAQGSLQRPDDASLNSELYKSFVAAKPETIAELRGLLHEFMKADDEPARDRHLLELYRKVHALTARAGLAQFADIAQISSALEVLLKELHEQPNHINVSTRRTVAQSVEFIGELFNTSEPRGGDLPAPRILVVDDEVLSRRAIVHALERGNLKSTGVEDPTVALQMVSEQQFDLIVLDIQMPDLDGFELCTNIRALPNNQNTPVLFVTSLTDFKNRARATVCGGADFVAKPFFFIEVTIKAVTLILRKRLFPKAKAA